MDDSLVVGRDQAGDRGNVRSGQNLQSVKFEAFFATEGVEDLRGCTNSVLGDDAAAAGRPGASMANSVLNEDAAAAPERRWRGSPRLIGATAPRNVLIAALCLHSRLN